jgi:hypothetical protein
MALNRVINAFTWLGVFQMTIATSWNSGLHRRLAWCCCERGRPGAAPMPTCANEGGSAVRLGGGAGGEGLQPGVAGGGGGAGGAGGAGEGGVAV